MVSFITTLGFLAAVTSLANCGYIGGFGGGESGGFGGGESGGFGGGSSGGFGGGSSGGFGGGSSGGSGGSEGHAYSTIMLHQNAQSGGGGGYEEKYPYHFPEYKYDYAVKDFHTGDHKNAWEHRHGDKVYGGYMLKESDGTIRVVEYESDKHNGFNAIVKHLGKAEHPQIYGKYGGGGEGGSQGGY